MKLFIDDIRTPPDDTWHICRNVSSAIRALDMFYKEVVEVNLDHDISHQVALGGMSRPYPCDESFEAVARYMAKIRESEGLMGMSFDPVIQIHTSNYVGANNMQKILLDAGFTHVDAKVIGGANRLETIL